MINHCCSLFVNLSTYQKLIIGANIRAVFHRNIRGPEIIDPREEARSLERKIDEEMSSSELVEQAKLMGFDERMIRAVFKR